VDRNLALHVASAVIVPVAGVFYRHAALSVAPLRGSDSGGRWGARGAYPVLYLGRPPDSVVVEAYRHLVDDVENMRGDLVQPRRFVTCQVKVSKVLDLRNPASLVAVGLTFDDLIGPHEPCQRVGQAAHQLGLHGLLAPAATARGETLSLFERHLPAAELPVQVAEEIWEHLPTDPRQFRVIRGGAGKPD
jgi:RES domain-containing protein